MTVTGCADRIEARTGLRLTARDRALIPEPDPSGPGDPIAIGVWVANAPADDAIVCAARVALELRDERAAVRQAGHDVHGGDTAYWRASADRNRAGGPAFIPQQPARCDQCHDRLPNAHEEGRAA